MNPLTHFFAYEGEARLRRWGAKSGLPRLWPSMLPLPSLSCVSFLVPVPTTKCVCVRESAWECVWVRGLCVCVCCRGCIRNVFVLVYLPSSLGLRSCVLVRGCVSVSALERERERERSWNSSWVLKAEKVCVFECMNGRERERENEWDKQQKIGKTQDKKQSVIVSAFAALVLSVRMKFFTTYQWNLK